MAVERAEAPRSVELWRRSPLVLAGLVDRPADAEALARQLAADHPGQRFIGIVAADEGDDVEAVLSSLAPVVDELIFTAAASPHAIDGATLAWRALESFGYGQDFVFTVPRLGDALRYGLEVLTDAGRRDWEGTALLVTGSAHTLHEARAALATLPPDPP